MDHGGQIMEITALEESWKLKKLKLENLQNLSIIGNKVQIMSTAEKSWKKIWMHENKHPAEVPQNT